MYCLYYENSIMRPSILAAYFEPIENLPGIGTRLIQHFHKLFEHLDYEPVLFDLVGHIPRNIAHRGEIISVKDAQIGQINSFNVFIKKHKPGFKRFKKAGTPYTVIAQDDTGEIHITFFSSIQNYIEQMLPLNTYRIISGKVEKYHRNLSMAHPEYILKDTERSKLPRIQNIYPIRGNITQKQIYVFIQKALAHLPALPEWHDAQLLEHYKFPSLLQSLRNLHAPENEESLSPESVHMSRLAYDELFVSQMALLLVRGEIKKEKGFYFEPQHTHIDKLINNLSFSLSDGQKNAVDEILHNMNQPHAMLRLVQGDVGCGKTIIAIIAILNAIKNNTQTALMVPTEILARQHYKTCKELLEPLGGKVILLTGSNTKKEKQEIYKIISSGFANVIIGTHALFQEKINFKKLGLAVIDEQHRFGVFQRLTLQMRTNHPDTLPDILVMTATPIPRTLQLTNYGDMDVSRIMDKPKQRKKIHTLVLPKNRVDEIIERLRAIFKNNNAAYWVCTRIDDDENSDLTSAQMRYDYLKEQLPDITIELLHGRMKPHEKEAIMQRFKAGDCQLLVATTVIEVGIDVPHANIIIIENAENYGLAQLHQLRGRVGRGNEQSFCLLVYNEPLSKMVREKLTVMKHSDDGFLIAEKDLELRGSGEMLGTRQSGLQRLKFVDFRVHKHLLAVAHDDAKSLLRKDPTLSSKRGQAVQLLIHLFRRSDTVPFIRSG